MKKEPTQPNPKISWIVALAIAASVIYLAKFTDMEDFQAPTSVPYGAKVPELSGLPPSR